MAEQQLWLLERPRPLRERLGDAFFRTVPACPGVYLMRDACGRVLYVGQSGNLRHRLNSYKNVRPGQAAAKLVRLAQAVESIEWQECDSPEVARLRENQLLRFHRPRFNSVNTHPEAYGYIGLGYSDSCLRLWLTGSLESGADEELYGAFKGLRWQGYAVLLRLLGQCAQRRSPEDLPPLWWSARPPRRVELFVTPSGPGRPAAWGEWTRSYLGGDSNELLERIREALPVAKSPTPFWGQAQALDLEAAEEFFVRGPRRLRELRERHGVRSRVMVASALDDLLAVMPGRGLAADRDRDVGNLPGSGD